MSAGWLCFLYFCSEYFIKRHHQHLHEAIYIENSWPLNSNETFNFAMIFHLSWLLYKYLYEAIWRSHKADPQTKTSKEERGKKYKILSFKQNQRFHVLCTYSYLKLTNNPVENKLKVKQLNPKIPPASAPHPEPSEHMCLVRWKLKLLLVSQWLHGDLLSFNVNVNDCCHPGQFSRRRRYPQSSTPRRWDLRKLENLTKLISCWCSRWTSSRWPTATFSSPTWTGSGARRSRRPRKPHSDWYFEYLT